MLLSSCIFCHFEHSFFQKEKKGEKSEEAPEKTAPTEEKPQEKKDRSFKIIRRQSEVKVSKKALKSGSRNPSITKVFENGKRIDQPELPEETQENMDNGMKKNQDQETPKQKQPLERFFARDIDYSETNTQEEFKIHAKEGERFRVPMLKDRSNFGSHLDVDKDGNLSGVRGIGIHSAVSKANSQIADIEKKNKDMLERVQRDLLANSMDIPIFGDNEIQNKKPTSNILDKIDSETLLLADAINNPKFKTKK